MISVMFPINVNAGDIDIDNWYPKPETLTCFRQVHSSSPPQPRAEASPGTDTTYRLSSVQNSPWDLRLVDTAECVYRRIYRICI